MNHYTLERLSIDVGALYDHGIARGLAPAWAGLAPLYSVAPEQFTLVTGVPGSGKSEFLDALLIELMRAHPGARTVYYSPENRPYQLHVSKLLAKYTGKPFAAGINARMSREEARQATLWLTQRVTFVEESNNGDSIYDVLNAEQFPVQDMFWWSERSAHIGAHIGAHVGAHVGARSGAHSAHAAQAAQAERPMFLVIDPWNFLDKRKQRDETEADYLSAALTEVDRFVHHYGAHVFIVAHPKVINREKDGSRPVPTPYDVSGGAHWFNKADNILCVHRSDKTNWQAPVEIHVQKIRFSHIGKVGLCRLAYHPPTGQYSDYPTAN